LARVIVEEFFRGLAVYFLTFLLIIFVASQFYRELISLSVIFAAPLITAAISFCFFVYMRKITGKDYQIKRGSVHYRVNMSFFVICCFLLIILGVRNIADENSLFGLMWVCLGIFFWGLGNQRSNKKI
jgi:hypothetical protein